MSPNGSEPSLGPSRKLLATCLVVIVLASLLAVLFAFYSCRLVWQSIEFHDISTGNDATPLWIPQLVMALGTVIFALAFVDELVLEIQGRRCATDSGEMLRNE